jgi:hypothetical protein
LGGVLPASKAPFFFEAFYGEMDGGYFVRYEQRERGKGRFDLRKGFFWVTARGVDVT